MRELLAVVAACVFVGLAQADPTPAPLTTDPHLRPASAVQAPVPPQSSPLLDPTPVLVELPKAPAEEEFRVSLDIGLPTGVRLQARLFESRFWAEVGVGVWWLVPYASTALRYDMHLYEGERNAIAVRPSVSFTMIPIREVAYGFGGDIEFIWQHRFKNRMITDLGFRIGASSISDNDGRWWSVPVATFVLALQF